MRRKAEAARCLKGQTQIRQYHFCCNLLAKASHKGKGNRLHLLMGRMTHACKDRKKQAIAIFEIYLPYSSTLISCEFVTVPSIYSTPFSKEVARTPQFRSDTGARGCLDQQGPVLTFITIQWGGGKTLEMMVEQFIYRSWTRCPRAPTLTKLSSEEEKSPINTDPLPAWTECISGGHYELKEKRLSSFHPCPPKI